MNNPPVCKDTFDKISIEDWEEIWFLVKYSPIIREYICRETEYRSLKSINRPENESDRIFLLNILLELKKIAEINGKTKY